MTLQQRETTSHTVNLRYERHELYAFFDVADAERRGERWTL